MRSYFAREYDRAEHEFADCLELDPSSAVAHLFLGLTLTEARRHEEALRMLEKAVSLAGSPEAKAGLGYALGRAGRDARARALLEELHAARQERYVSPSLIAQVYAALGDVDAALDWLEQATDARAADVAWLAVRPVFDRLRPESSFNASVARLGL
jgi:tetratricopeptide (TPR) repeat protein